MESSSTTTTHCSEAGAASITRRAWARAGRNRYCAASVRARCVSQKNEDSEAPGVEADAVRPDLQHCLGVLTLAPRRYSFGPTIVSPGVREAGGASSVYARQASRGSIPQTLGDDNARCAPPLEFCALAACNRLLVLMISMSSCVDFVSSTNGGGGSSGSSVMPPAPCPPRSATTARAATARRAKRPIDRQQQYDVCSGWRAACEGKT
eukprot:1402264-Prymnesium_polylepis.1